MPALTLMVQLLWQGILISSSWRENQHQKVRLLKQKPIPNGTGIDLFLKYTLSLKNVTKTK